VNIAEIADKFVRAAEVERVTGGHIGPAPLRAQQLPYVHTCADKAGWRKEAGDMLERGADPLAEERQAFWKRFGLMPSSSEISELDRLHSALISIGTAAERRALFAWARAKAGGKAFAKWCRTVERIHPETGRKRRNRALEQIHRYLTRRATLDCETGSPDGLRVGADSGDIFATLDEVAGKRKGPNRWLDDGAFSNVFSNDPADFTWAGKRNERRRQREAAKRKEEAA
jgi:hypothetical protein